MLQAHWLKSKILAVSWFIIMNILFVLPGSALPKTNWFTDVQIDKWVHVGLFAVLVFLWCSAFDTGLPKKGWAVLIVAIAYGVLIELVQRSWVPNRSFDLYDVFSDAIGSVIGLIVWLRANKKVKGE
jgi:VanZ family protein